MVRILSQHHRKNWQAFWWGGIVGSLFIIGVLFDSNTHTPTQVDRHFAKTTSYNESWQDELPLLREHIETPKVVRGIYLSSWTAGTKTARDRLIEFIRQSGVLNSVIIDIKDSTGIVSYTGNDDLVRSVGSYSKRIKNISSVIREFHENGIYVIGRITAFEDPYLATKYDKFVLNSLDGSPWRNTKNTRQWIDPSNIEYHDYLIRIAREAYTLGVDEINFDYVRYPSEGNTTDILLPNAMTKSDVMTTFFTTIDEELRKKSQIPISADVFGLTTTESTDMGIGQVWDKILPYVDYLAPMIYPSHYAPGSFGYTNPAEFPAEIITRAVQGALEKTRASGESITKIRPWIQDFDLGAIYEKQEVRAQIKALSDVGIDSFLSWDPTNRYTQNAYNNEEGLESE